MYLSRFILFHFTFVHFPPPFNKVSFHLSWLKYLLCKSIETSASFKFLKTKLIQAKAISSSSGRKNLPDF